MKYFLAVLLLVIALLFYWAIFNYYSAANSAPSYYDVVLHFLAGVWLAGAALLIFQSRYVNLSGGFWTVLILVLGTVALVGVLWEFYEYLATISFSLPKDPIEDILSDLLADLMGAGIFAATHLIYKSRKTIPW